MMIYYIFNTEQEALAAEQQIVDNVRQVEANVPDALSEDGLKLRGRNAKTGEFTDAYTTRWAVPQQILDGRWVFAKPTEEKTAPIPVEAFTNGVIANENEYNSDWFIDIDIME